MRRKLAIIMALLALAGTAPLLTACYTTKGAGQDLQAAGHGLRTRRSGTPLSTVIIANKEIDMDKDRIEGAGKQAKGKVKETWGKMTGDAKTEAEGQADKAEGRAQNAVGGMKDSARDARDKVTGKE